LEHSVANMFFFPLGWAAGAPADLAAATANLLWVTLGNILGGAGGVALAYRFAYLGPTGRRPPWDPPPRRGLCPPRRGPLVSAHAPPRPPPPPPPATRLT